MTTLVVNGITETIVKIISVVHTTVRKQIMIHSILIVRGLTSKIRIFLLIYGLADLWFR